MCTFPKCLRGKRSRNRILQIPPGTRTSRKCTFLPTPGATPYRGSPLTKPSPYSPASSPPNTTISSAVLLAPMFTFRKRLCHKRFPGRDPCSPCNACPSQKCTFLPSPARRCVTPHVQLTRSPSCLPSYRSAPGPRSDCRGNNVHFPLAAVPQVFPGPRPLQPFQRLPFTEVHIVTIAGGAPSRDPRLAKSSAYCILPARRHHILGTLNGTNVHFPRALVPPALPGPRPL